MNDNRERGPLVLKKPSLISVYDYARLHNVHVNTVYVWIKKGYLHPLPYWTGGDKSQKRYQLSSAEPRPYPITGRNAGQHNAVSCVSDFDPKHPARQITMDEAIEETL